MRRERTALILVVIVMAATCVSAAILGLVEPAERQEKPRLNWQRILSRSFAVYARCENYRDRGVVSERIVTANGTATHRVKFSTVFRRTGEFRFESEAGSRGRPATVLWRRDGDVMFWLGNEARDQRSLASGVAAADRASSGAAGTIAALLMPDRIPGRSLRDFSGVDKVSIEVVDRATCFKFQGRWAGGTATVWIDARTSLVRRVETVAEMDGGRRHRVVAFRPRVDVRIRDHEFDPNPPEMVVTPR